MSSGCSHKFQISLKWKNNNFIVFDIRLIDALSIYDVPKD